MTTQTDPQVETGLSETTLNLVALGAAIGACAERAFRAHETRLEELGVSKEDMIQAVNIALRVKGDAHQVIMGVAQSLLTESGGCCGSDCSCEGEGKEKGEGNCGEDCGCH
jgi:hypothetical protein